VKASKEHANDVPVFVTKMYQEPRQFIKLFHGWSYSRLPKKVTSLPCFSLILTRSLFKVDTVPWKMRLADILKSYLITEYPYDVLKQSPRPLGADPTNLEVF